MRHLKLMGIAFIYFNPCRLYSKNVLLVDQLRQFDFTFVLNYCNCESLQLVWRANLYDKDILVHQLTSLRKMTFCSYISAYRVPQTFLCYLFSFIGCSS